jgi:hypothetical protein
MEGCSEDPFCSRKENVRTVCYGALSVKLFGRDERLFMVVVKALARSIQCF